MWLIGFELDAGKVSNNQLLCKGVQKSFKGQDEAYENMHFADDEVFSELSLIAGKDFVECGRV